MDQTVLSIIGFVTLFLMSVGGAKRIIDLWARSGSQAKSGWSPFANPFTTLGITALWATYAGEHRIMPLLIAGAIATIVSALELGMALKKKRRVDAE